MKIDSMAALQRRGEDEIQRPERGTEGITDVGNATCGIGAAFGYATAAESATVPFNSTMQLVCGSGLRR